MTLDTQIEAILFYRGEPVKISKLASLLEKKEGDIKEALEVLSKRLTGGLELVVNDGEAMLGTGSQMSKIISKINKEELERELGKAGLETLSIILYKGPVSKKEIDYIRGVNSSFILRNLLIRGLVEKAEKKNERSVYYQGTIELLAFMGLKSVEDLPEYTETKEELENLKLNQENQEE